MKIHAKLARRIRLVTIILLIVVLVPYAFSRIISSRRNLSVNAIESLPATSGNDAVLRVACYNIAHGRGLAMSNWRGGTAEERKKRLSDIAGLLRSFNADIVVLNEVDFDSSWSSSTNQARFLARKAGYPYWAEQRNIDFRLVTWKWRFGNAVLSRHPILQAGVVDFPGFSAVETLFAGKKRGVICTIDVNGVKLRIMGVHLCHRSEAVRARSAETIIKVVSSGIIPTIVAGDFNSSPTGFPNSQSNKVAGNALDILDASLLFQRQPKQFSGSQGELTYHSTRPISVIDWILIPTNGHIFNYRVQSTTLSDHRPVVAELSLKMGNK